MNAVDTYRTTVNTIASFIATQHPEVLRGLAQMHKNKVSAEIAAAHGNTVVYGPLRGLKLSSDAHWSGSDAGAMVLGIYEAEILAVLEILRGQYATFIDVGAADGYYAVGVLVGNLFPRCYCYEISPKGRQVITDSAIANGVLDRIVINGEAQKGFYQDLPTPDVQRSVVLMDIEGGEFELADAAFFEFFKESVLIIEVHEWVSDAGQKLLSLIEASRQTHDAVEYKTGTRDLSSYSELRHLTDIDRWLLCSENRPMLMRWFVFRPTVR